MEAAVFYLVLIIAGFFDIRAMARKGYKKEILPYLALAGLAGATGLYLINTEMDSITHFFISLLKLEG